MRNYWIPQLLLDDENPGSGGGTSENQTGSTAAADGSVTSGEASPDLIASVMASESSPDKPADSAEKALERAAAGDKPASGTTPGATSKDTKAPEKPGDQSQAATAKGPIPFDRHEAAVKNARESGAAEAVKGIEWAKGIDQNTANTVFGIAQDLYRDPKAFVTKIAGELGLKVVPVNDPAAGGAKETAPGGPFKLPKAKLRSEDGQGAYSEDQMAEIAESLIAQVRSEMQGALRPILSDRENAEKQRQINEVQERARATGQAALNEMRGLKAFQIEKDGKKIDHPKILENLKAIPASTRASIGPVAALYQAYLKYFNEDVLPTLGQTAEATVREENQRKAGASLLGKPNGSTKAATPRVIRDGDVNGLAKRMEELAGTLS